MWLLTLNCVLIFSFMSFGWADVLTAAGRSISWLLRNTFYGFLLYPVDERVFKDHRTLTYFLYMEFHFIRPKGEGPDVSRQAISKVGLFWFHKDTVDAMWLPIHEKRAVDVNWPCQLSFMIPWESTDYVTNLEACHLVSICLKHMDTVLFEFA